MRRNGNECEPLGSSITVCRWNRHAVGDQVSTACQNSRVECYRPGAESMPANMESNLVHFTNDRIECLSYPSTRRCVPGVECQMIRTIDRRRSKKADPDRWCTVHVG